MSAEVARVENGLVRQQKIRGFSFSRWFSLDIETHKKKSVSGTEEKRDWTDVIIMSDITPLLRIHYRLDET